jgi:hypothetical protein
MVQPCLCPTDSGSAFNSGTTGRVRRGMWPDEREEPGLAHHWLPFDFAQCCSTAPSIRDNNGKLGCYEGGAKLWPPNRTGRKGWAVSRWGINRPRPVQIVACAGTSLGWVAGLFEAQALPNALPALTKMPCRSHFPHQRQSDGIHRHAAGNVLHSLASSLPIGPPPFFISDRKLKIV